MLISYVDRIYLSTSFSPTHLSLDVDKNPHWRWAACTCTEVERFVLEVEIRILKEAWTSENSVGEGVR